MSEQKRRKIWIPEELYETLSEDAEERNMTVEEYVDKLLEIGMVTVQDEDAWQVLGLGQGNQCAVVFERDC